MAAKMMIVLNPRAGRGASRLEKVIRDRLAYSPVEIARTVCPGHATEIARRAVREGCCTVVAAGGDGTVNEVLAGLIGSQTALGIIPAGTANDLAHHLRLPRDLAQACDVIRTGVRRQTDVIRVNDRFFVTGGGVGLACDVAHVANYLKRVRGLGQLLGRVLRSWIYLAGALWAVLLRRGRGLSVNVESSKGAFTADALTLTISNQPCIGRRFQVSPGAMNDDGLFDICLIRNSLNVRAILRMMRRVLNGTHTLSPAVECWRGRHLRIELDKPRPFLFDGEVAPAAKTLEVGILPAALNLIVPEGNA